MSSRKNSKSEAGDDASEAIAAARDTSLETVRDILFGAQSREFEERFAALETRLRNSVDELGARVDANHKTLGEQLESLRKTVQQDASMLEQRVDKQFDEATAALATARADLERAIATLGDETDSQINALTKAMKAADEALAKEMDKLDARLQDEKLDRRSLGQLLVTLGSEISAEGEK